MIYPIDVQTSTSRSGKMRSGDKMKFIGILSLFLYVAIGFFSVAIFRSLGIPAWVPLVIETFLFGAIGIFVIRVVIFRESDREEEARGAEQDSLVSYYEFRNIMSRDSVISKKMTIPVYELSNGNTCFFIAFRFGENNDIRSAATKEALTKLFNLIGLYNYEHQEYVCREDFSKSPECRALLKRYSNIQNKKQSKVMMDTLNQVLTIGAEESQTLMMYMRVKTRYSYQHYELANTIGNLYKALTEQQTAYRSITFLDAEGVLECLIQWYGLETLDVSLMKVRDGGTISEELEDAIEVYQLVTTTGKVYTNDLPIDRHLQLHKPL